MGAPAAASSFVPAEWASSVPAGWDLSVPGACYVKYVDRDSPPTVTNSATCGTDAHFFYITKSCFDSLRYPNFAGATLNMDHYRGTTLQRSNVPIHIFSGILNFGSDPEDLFHGRSNPATYARNNWFQANDYLIIPPYVAP